MQQFTNDPEIRKLIMEAHEDFIRSVNHTAHNPLLTPTIEFDPPALTFVDSLNRIAEAMEKKMTTELHKQTKELERQADAQMCIARDIRQERTDRAKDDRKYFWLGVLCSFIVSMAVEHGSELLQLLQRAIQP